jgi:soluble lytic murein transglycosylase-like protein
VLRILAFLLCAVAVGAAEPESTPASSVAKMQAAAEKQRASARRQTSVPEPSGFFTTPWLDRNQQASFAPAANVQAGCDPIPAEQLQKLIADAAAAEAMDPLLLQAMVARESAGRPCAVSAKGAQGLMQIMPQTQADLGLDDAFDPAANISAGARYMKLLLGRYKGDLRLALAAYNAGPQRVDADNGVPRIAETQAYVSAIVASLRSADQPLD